MTAHHDPGSGVELVPCDCGDDCERVETDCCSDAQYECETEMSYVKLGDGTVDDSFRTCLEGYGCNIDRPRYDY